MSDAPAYTPNPARFEVTAQSMAEHADKQRRYIEKRALWRAQWVHAPTPTRTWLSARTAARATVHDPRQPRLL